MKRSAPDDWMEEDDLLLENELREKAKHDQDQKRRLQDQHGGFPLSGKQQFQDSEAFRSDSHFSGELAQDHYAQFKGWHDEPHREHLFMEGGSRREVSARGCSGVDLVQEVIILVGIRINLCLNGKILGVQGKKKIFKKVGVMLDQTLGCLDLRIGGHVFVVYNLVIIKLIALILLCITNVRKLDI